MLFLFAFVFGGFAIRRMLYTLCSHACSVDYTSPMRSADFRIRRMLYTRSLRIANPNTHYAAD